MKKLAIIITLFALSLSQIVSAQTPIGNIDVKGFGSVNVFPNAATITLNIKFVKPTLREAINETQKTELAVINIIKRYVSNTSEIMKGFISTDKSNYWNEKLQKYIFMGFESQQSIVFPLKDLNKMEKFTEEILKTRIQEITSISYFHTDAATFYKKAQDLAIKDALESTQRIAQSSGVKLGKINFVDTDASPNTALYQTYNTESFQAYGKMMGGRGVRSSGQLIHFTASITMRTNIIE